MRFFLIVIARARIVQFPYRSSCQFWFRASTFELLRVQRGSVEVFMTTVKEQTQQELAESFSNSVSCRILHRNYYHNDFLFVRPALSSEHIDSDPLEYTDVAIPTERFAPRANPQ